MKSFCARRFLAALALLALGRGAMAQDPNFPYGVNSNPSILPLPQTRSVAPPASDATPVGYQIAQPAASTPVGYQTAPPSSSMGNYRQAMAQPSAASDPPLGSSSDVGPSAAESIGNGSTNGGSWWKFWGNNNSSGGGSNIPSAMACGSEAGCLSCNPCCGGGGARWFGSVGGIFMTRNTPNPFWTTYQNNNDPNQLMNTKQAGNGLWGGGGQATFGRWWCPCCSNPCSCGPQYAYGLQFTYWQIGDMSSHIATNGPTQGLSTPIDFTGPQTMVVPSGPMAGSSVQNYFDGTEHQAIWRTDRFLNIEVNGLVQPIYNNPGCFSCTLLGGFRYFRFQDVLTYGSVLTTFDWNSNGGQDAAYLQSNVTNNLFGAQIGTLLNFAITPRFGVFALPKGGVFGNQININNRLYLGDGTQIFNLQANQTVCSLMGELDTGFYWWMSQNCQLFFGWRVIGVTNVALADNQFLPYMQDAAGFQAVKSNGDLILTGGFGGIAFAF